MTNVLEFKYFECHLTFNTPEPDVREFLERVAEENGWKTSEIARDPVLGLKPYYYLTKHGPSYDSLLKEMQIMSSLTSKLWIRRKIESIVYDERRPVGVKK